jgi:glutamate racemase
MINPGTEAALQVSRNKRIGIVATRGTVKSGNYDRALEELDREVKVFSQPCPELLRIAEEGGTEDTEYLFDLARRSISPVLEEGIDTLVLGCTDFTCIREAVDAAVPDQVQIVDPAVQVTERLEEALRQKGWLASSDEPTSSHRFWVTGEKKEQFMSFGEEFLGIPIAEVHTAKIDWRGE